MYAKIHLHTKNGYYQNEKMAKKILNFFQKNQNRSRLITRMNINRDETDRLFFLGQFRTDGFDQWIFAFARRAIANEIVQIE